MSVLISEAKILDPQSTYHRKKANILIKDGIISYIGDRKQKADVTIDASGATLSPGWFDLSACFGDPGNEHKEDLDSGREVAMAGGFTEVAVLPNTNPPVQTKNDVEYLKRSNHKSLVQLLPIAAISKNLKGEDFTEIIDLKEAGAVAFSDGLVPIWHTDLLRKSMLYVQKFDGLIIDRPEEKWLSQFGVMNESINSALVGMKGIPSVGEEIAINRDLKVLEYTGGKLHLSNISTAESVKLIRRAKKNGLKVTCDVVAHQLIYTDDEVNKFDAVYKVNPPLRTEKDIRALIKGLNDGTIDAIVSGHQPQDEENTKLEYDLAADGMNNMQVVLPLLNMLKDELSIDLILDKLTAGPRNILGLKNPIIEKGELANLTLFHPRRKWSFDAETNKSKSENSPLLGHEVTGKVLAVFNNGHFKEV